MSEQSNYSNKHSFSLIDTHCHLDFSEFDKDRKEVIALCSNNNVQHIVVPSVSQQRFKRTINLCADYSNLHLALGLHPMFIEQHQPHHLLDLDTQIKKNGEHVVAVGEIGLDFYIKGSADRAADQAHLDQEKQVVFFTKQLIIAKQHRLPVIIHNRKAHDLCIKLLDEHKITGGIIHAFNGSLQQAYKYHELGFKLGFGGMLTFKRSNKLRKLAEKLPLECIVLETDAPDMTVAQHRGQRNSPAYLPFILESLAEIRAEKIETIAQQTSMNARNVLKIGC